MGKTDKDALGEYSKSGSKGISVVKLEKKVGDTEVIMPYMKMESALTYLRNLIFEDAIAFTRKTEYFLDLILASSNEVKDATRIPSAYQELGKIYEQVYLDMVPLNAFMRTENLYSMIKNLL